MLDSLPFVSLSLVMNSIVSRLFPQELLLWMPEPIALASWRALLKEFCV